ncbi:MAG TPA: hypothetical protein VIV40_01045 [Kofleriaceae bacterium]
MATKPRYDFEEASQDDIDAAVRPFVERFVLAEKRERALSLFLPLKKRARPRDLVDAIDAKVVVELDGTARAAKAVAQIDLDLEGIYINGKPAAFRMRFAQARTVREFAYSDEEVFIARDGGCALVTFEVGVDWLLALPSRT